MKPMVCAILLLVVTPAFAQQLDSLVETDLDGGPTCQQNQTAAIAPLTASCPNVTWSDSFGDSGVATATGTANYGFLQAYMSASETIVAQSHTTTGRTYNTEFHDVVYFPGLTVNAYLRATLTLSGTASGDLTASSAGASVTLAGGGAQCAISNAANGVTPMSSSFKGTCGTRLAVAPADGAAGVRLDSLLSLVANAGPALGPNTGTDTVTITYNGKNQGASAALVLIDANGKPIKGVKITSASGTKYPTR